MITNALNLPLGSVTPTDGNLLVGNTGVWQTTTMSGGATLNASGILTIDLSAGPQITGVLPIANGGTNSNTQATNGVAVYNGTSIATSDALTFNVATLGILADTAASNSIVGAIVGSSSPLAFFTASRPSDSNTSSAQLNFNTAAGPGAGNDWTLGTGIGTSPGNIVSGHY